MMNSRLKIAVFDSGVGGLTLQNEIRSLLPSAQYIYWADVEFHPYGLKSDEDIESRLLSLIPELLEQVQPDILVVACNTAATLVLDSLRKLTNVPIVGIVPAIKPAASLTSSKVFALLATPATVQRPYTDQLIDVFASDCQVIKVGSSRLVEMAEQKCQGDDLDLDDIRSELVPILRNNTCDTVVLACTHFSHLKKEFSTIAPHIHWIDPNEAVAKQVLRVSETLSE